MIPVAIPSLAEYTPTILSAPIDVMALCISLWALSGLQSGVSNSLPMLTAPSSTDWAPFLN